MPKTYQENCEILEELSDSQAKQVVRALLQYFSSNQLAEFIEHLEDDGIV